jgi:hypothetical protein
VGGMVVEADVDLARACGNPSGNREYFNKPPRHCRMKDHIPRLEQLPSDLIGALGNVWPWPAERRPFCSPDKLPRAGSALGQWWKQYDKTNRR